MIYSEQLELHGIKYAIENNRATVIGIGENTQCDIEIPEHIFDNIEVVAVADKAFFKQSNIESITLPETVEYIGKNAFSWCPALKSIRLHGVKIIDERAFMGDARLSVIDFSDKLTSVGDKAFAYCNSLSAIVLPENLSHLGEAVFEGCRYLRFVLIPDGIDVIRNGTFYACTALCEAHLPESLKYIDEYAFAYCVSLSDFEIADTTVINRDAFYECRGTHNRTLVS